MHTQQERVQLFLCCSIDGMGTTVRRPLLRLKKGSVSQGVSGEAYTRLYTVWWAVRLDPRVSEMNITYTLTP